MTTPILARRTTTDKLIQRRLQEAYQVATLSPDPSTQNGALLLKSGNVAVKAFNGFPPGVEASPNRLHDRATKYRFIEHAERAVIFRAMRDGMKLHEKVMVCPWAACADCARAIVGVGIEALYVHREALDYGSEGRWDDSVLAGMQILEEGGVPVVFFEGTVGGVVIRRNGEPWAP